MPETDKGYIVGAVIAGSAVVIAAIITGYCAFSKNSNDPSKNNNTSSNSIALITNTPIPINSVTPSPTPSPINYENFFEVNNPHPKPFNVCKIGMRVSEVKSIFNLLKYEVDISNSSLNVKFDDGAFSSISFNHHGDDSDPKIYMIYYYYRDQNVKKQISEDAQAAFISDTITKKALNTIFQWSGKDAVKAEIDRNAYIISLVNDDYYNK